VSSSTATAGRQAAAGASSCVAAETELDSAEAHAVSDRLLLSGQSDMPASGQADRKNLLHHQSLHSFGGSCKLPCLLTYASCLASSHGRPTRLLLLAPACRPAVLLTPGLTPGPRHHHHALQQRQPWQGISAS
jgi:hypothetical protein